MTKSAFHWNDGTPSIFSTDPAFNKNVKTGQRATASVQSLRDQGRDNSTLYGISQKADELVALYRRNHISFDPDSQGSADKTQRIKKGGI